MPILKRYVATLDCDLTEKEILAYGRELAQINQEIASEEDRQSSLKQELKARIAGIEARRTEISAKVNRGKELREVQIEVTADFKTDMATEIRMDTGEVYRERPLRDRRSSRGYQRERRSALFSPTQRHDPHRPYR